MPSSSSPYYQPSGRTPLTGALLLLVGAGAAAVPLGIVYVLAVRYIPIIYLNLLAVVAFGFGYAVLVARLARLGKLRAPLTATALGFVAGGVATWLQWVFFAAFIISRGDEVPLVPAYLGFLTNPAALGAFMRAAAEHGTWSMKDGAPVKGVVLVIIWVAESLVIVVPAAMFARGQAEKPFSEALQRWARCVKLPGRLPFFADRAATRQRLASGDLMPLVTNEPPAAMQYARLELWRAEGDPACSYLSVENVTETLDKKGRTQTTARPIVTHLRVPAELAQQLEELHTTAPAAHPPATPPAS